MNIKSLRKNYDKLSKRERFILFDSAENRDDEAEMDAILLATPNETWRRPEFSSEAENLLILRLVRLSQRLNHARDALLWILMSAKGDCHDDVFYKYARVSAYFYCVTSEVDAIIYKELGLDSEAWKARENELFDFSFSENITERLMTSLAFTESELEEFLNEMAGERGLSVNRTSIAFTVAKETEALRGILRKRGFADFFQT